MWTTGERRSPRRMLVILAMSGLLGWLFAGHAVAAFAGGTETLVLVASTPSWGPATPVCPDGQVMGSFISQDEGHGRILSCVQSTDYFGPPSEPDSWVEHTNLTLVLPSGQIKATADIGVSSSWDSAHEYQTLIVNGNGTVTGGTGHYAGRTGTFSNVGSIIVGPDSVTGSVTFTITLG